MSKHKLTNNKLEKEFEILHRRTDSKDKIIYISSNHSNNLMLENEIEKQNSKSEPMNSKVISNVDNNTIEREIEIITSNNRTMGKNDYTLKNTVANVTMKYSLKLKNNNSESKHTTSHTFRNNVDNITLTHKFTTLNNRNESKIKGTPNYNDNSNNNTMNHKIANL